MSGSNAGTKRPVSAFRELISQDGVRFFIAGGFAGAVSRTLVSPLERHKILLQVQSAGKQKQMPMFWQTYTKLWQREGWRCLFAGNGVNCIRMVPFSAVRLGSYESYKELIFEDEPGTPLTPLKGLGCGTLAGITAVTATYPLDIARTRFSIDSAVFGRLNHQRPSLWILLKEIHCTEGGFRALFRGLTPTIFAVGPYVGLEFAIYESMRKLLTPQGQDSPSMIGTLFAGTISGALASTGTYPLEVIRRHYQVHALSSNHTGVINIWHCVRVIVSTEGFRGLYKGLWPNLLKMAPIMGSSWLTYETTKAFLKPDHATTIESGESGTSNEKARDKFGKEPM